MLSSLKVTKMETQLKSKGWNLSVEGLKSCTDACQKSNPTVNDIIKKALDSDLRHIGQKILPENINSGQIESIKGPIVLQLQKMRNITAPLINQESSGAPRMMKLTLTDGCTTCVAIEFKMVNCLKLDMIPGIKLCLTSSSISLLKGVILLEDGDVKILGGEVEKLKSKWESNREAKCLKKKGDVEGPPPYKDFDPSKPIPPKQKTKWKNCNDAKTMDNNVSRQYEGKDTFTSQSKYVDRQTGSKSSNNAENSHKLFENNNEKQRQPKMSGSNKDETLYNERRAKTITSEDKDKSLKSNTEQSKNPVHKTENTDRPIVKKQNWIHNKAVSENKMQNQYPTPKDSFRREQKSTKNEYRQKSDDSIHLHKKSGAQSDQKSYETSEQKQYSEHSKDRYISKQTDEGNNAQRNKESNYKKGEKNNSHAYGKVDRRNYYRDDYDYEIYRERDRDRHFEIDDRSRSNKDQAYDRKDNWRGGREDKRDIGYQKYNERDARENNDRSRNNKDQAYDKNDNRKGGREDKKDTGYQKYNERENNDRSRTIKDKAYDKKDNWRGGRGDKRDTGYRKYEEKDVHENNDRSRNNKGQTYDKKDDRRGGREDKRDTGYQKYNERDIHENNDSSRNNKDQAYDKKDNWRGGRGDKRDTGYRKYEEKDVHENNDRSRNNKGQTYDKKDDRRGGREDKRDTGYQKYNERDIHENNDSSRNNKDQAYDKKDDRRGGREDKRDTGYQKYNERDACGNNDRSRNNKDQAYDKKDNRRGGKEDKRDIGYKRYNEKNPGKDQNRMQRSGRSYDKQSFDLDSHQDYKEEKDDTRDVQHSKKTIKKNYNNDQTTDMKSVESNNQTEIALSRENCEERHSTQGNVTQMQIPSFDSQTMSTSLNMGVPISLNELFGKNLTLHNESDKFPKPQSANNQTQQTMGQYPMNMVHPPFPLSQDQLNLQWSVTQQQDYMWNPYQQMNVGAQNFVPDLNYMSGQTADNNFMQDIPQHQQNPYYYSYGNTNFFPKQ
ncbi:tudor domain-containing protein 3-like [Hydractinia symbiolongicarpus]|uniref:tudor domain-containing protein 3-like n=1 Tax=Hydractinia symbiolongicarpus TaxID=13093 RepID=UPI00254C05D6|nr:tudor domain-containing protein 3-like [Hydractinia symbiolongicarpus]